MSDARWADLAPRVLSGAAMVGIGLGAVWLGGLWFHALIAAICGLMVWELVCMLDTNRSKSELVLGIAAAADAMIGCRF